MKSARWVACALAIGIPAAGLAQSPSPAPASAGSAQVSLAGLWQAKRRFGPDERGTLIVTRMPTGYVADLAGRRFDMQFERGELRFELPGDRGQFNGRFEDGFIRGYWVQPGTPADNGRWASPARLRSTERDKWVGVVEPRPDTFTFYLLLRPRPDGSLDAILRNPERDVGTQFGAPLRLVREGDTLRLLGQRGDAPEREITRGRYDPETGGFSLFIADRGGTFDFVPDGDASFFWPRGRNPTAYRYAPPPQRDDGWRTDTLEHAGIDRPALERLVQRITAMPMDSTDAPQIHALLVARHGRLVLEEYFHDAGRDTLHDIRSAAKSITSVTIGAAMHAGAPLELSSPVYAVMNGGAFPADLDDPRKRAMTLEHLLTMSSGYFCDDTNDEAPGNEDRMSEQAKEPDWYRYTMQVPLATPPGDNSVYCSASPHLALGMLGRATGEQQLLTFDRLVAEPMRIDRYAWPLDPVGHPYGGGGVRLLPRDFLKFGQLMLDGGAWNGRRIVDSDFAAAATSPRYHLRNVYYGYFWWIEDLPYKDRTVRSFSARGNGGNLVWVIPELDLVVATMAGNYFSRSQLTYTGPLIARSILPAVRERGDDLHAPVQDREFTSAYGRSSDGSRVTSTRER